MEPIDGIPLSREELDGRKPDLDPPGDESIEVPPLNPSSTSSGGSPSSPLNQVDQRDWVEQRQPMFIPNPDHSASGGSGSTSNMPVQAASSEVSGFPINDRALVLYHSPMPDPNSVTGNTTARSDNPPPVRLSAFQPIQWMFRETVEDLAHLRRHRSNAISVTGNTTASSENPPPVRLGMGDAPVAFVFPQNATPLPQMTQSHSRQSNAVPQQPVNREFGHVSDLTPSLQEHQINLLCAIDHLLVLDGRPVEDVREAILRTPVHLHESLNHIAPLLNWMQGNMPGNAGAMNLLRYANSHTVEELRACSPTAIHQSLHLIARVLRKYKEYKERYDHPAGRRASPYFSEPGSNRPTMAPAPPTGLNTPPENRKRAREDSERNPPKQKKPKTGHVPQVYPDRSEAYKFSQSSGVGVQSNAGTARLSSIPTSAYPANPEIKVEPTYLEPPQYSSFLDSSNTPAKPSPAPSNDGFAGQSQSSNNRVSRGLSRPPSNIGLSDLDLSNFKAGPAVREIIARKAAASKDDHEPGNLKSYQEWGPEVKEYQDKNRAKKYMKREVLKAELNAICPHAYEGWVYKEMKKEIAAMKVADPKLNDQCSHRIWKQTVKYLEIALNGAREYQAGEHKNTIAALEAKLCEFPAEARPLLSWVETQMQGYRSKCPYQMEAQRIIELLKETSGESDEDKSD